MFIINIQFGKSPSPFPLPLSERECVKKLDVLGNMSPRVWPPPPPSAPQGAKKKNTYFIKSCTQTRVDKKKKLFKIRFFRAFWKNRLSYREGDRTPPPDRGHVPKKSSYFMPSRINTVYFDSLNIFDLKKAESNETQHCAKLLYIFLQGFWIFVL